MEPLKNLINEELVNQYAEKAKKHFAQFDKASFCGDILNSQWEGRELRDRINHITKTFRAHLPEDFDEAISILEKVAGELPTGFEYMIPPSFVEFYGLDHFDSSMLALERLTEYSTGEFAIRPFLKADPEKTLAVMKEWTRHSNHHVRRLASEGCRPRLPWGGNLNFVIQDPSLVLDILQMLRKDDSLYVRKSVANNLNDISKDHPDQVIRIARAWLKEDHENSNWIVKRELRTLLKQAHPEALKLFGFADSKQLSVLDFHTKSNEVKIGGRLDFGCSIKNESETNSKVRAEYLIDYKKKTGVSSKVFQLFESELKPGEVKQLSKYQAMHDMTTRKHYPGPHAIHLRLNGDVKKSLSFELI